MDRPGVVDHEPDPRYEPVDAPEAASFPEPDHSAHGERGYEPVRPRSGLGDLFSKLTAPLVGLGFLLLKFGGLLLKFKVVTTGGVHARLDRGVHLDLGAAVRDRLRAPDLRPRARARRRAAAPGRPGERAALHPLPRRGGRDEGAPRRRLEGGARRARRPDPRIRRRGRVLDRRRSDGLRVPRSRSPSSASSSTSSTSSRSCRSTAAGRPERSTRRSGSSGLLMMVALVVVNPNPLLVIIVVLGGLDLWNRWRAARRSRRLLPPHGRPAGRRRRRLPRPHRGARGGDVRHARRAHVLMANAAGSPAGSSGARRSRSPPTSR